ncbi:MAG TPA: MOSC N-terminal beta barrel domain-containing protein, partial [Candidatus Binatia bacterium]|nr:MOSC N-terminal beta barrel domain-containing protein [Candidatus Binatia bacterium]
TIGTVREVWRYPVKSMGGEQVPRVTLGALGLPGDRGWALRDEAAGEIRGAKKLPSLMLCSARYVAEPGTGAVPAAEVTLPDGTTFRTDAPDASERLSAFLGRAVTLWPLQPATSHDHYRRGLPDDPDMMAELRTIFGRLEDEPMPDLSVFPAEIFEYTSPLGTYFDAFPLHVLTTASLDALGPREQFDTRRFRPNVLIETPAGVTGTVEAAWSGRQVRIGAAVIEVKMPTVRCSMPTQAQPGLRKDPSVLRAIVRSADQNLGAYATIVSAGSVAVGDPVELV